MRGGDTLAVPFDDGIHFEDPKATSCPHNAGVERWS
jgi:hypothetical protein